MLPRLLIFALFALATAFLAKRKGFNPLLWVFAGGPIGLVILLLLPAASADHIDSQESLVRAKRANTVGAFLSMIVLIITAMILGLIFFPGFL